MDKNRPKRRKTRTGRTTGAESDKDLTKPEKQNAERTKAGESPGESEERYQRFVDSALDLIYETDEAGILRFISPSAKKLIGYSLDEIIGKRYLDFIPPEFREEQSSFLGRIVREKIPASIYETPVLARDGHVIWLWQSASLIFEGDKVTGFRVIARDITDRKMAEEALRESEERWKFALEGSGDGLWDWDAQTNKVFFSGQWKAMLGYGMEEIGDTLDEWDRRVHPEDRERVYAEINRHFKGETPVYVSEHRVLCKDGTYKWILDRGKVISRTPDGKPLRVIGTHTDLTELKRAEKLISIQRDLGASLSSISHLYEALNVVLNAGLQIEGIDSGGIYLADPSTGALDLAVHAGLSLRFVHAASHFKADSPLVVQIQAGEPIYGTYDALGQTADHELKSEKLRFLAVIPVLYENRLLASLNFASHTHCEIPDASCRAMETMATRMGGVIGRIRAEEALHERETTLRTITASAHDAIIMIDGYGKITFWNVAAEQTLGWGRDEVMGRDLHLLLAPERYHKDYKRAMEHFRATGQGNAVGKTLELSAVRKDATEIPIELSLSAVQLAGSWHSVGIMRDITDRKRAEAERMEFDRRLQQAQKLESLGILAGGIAHDFNNLLMGMLGNLDLTLLDLPQSSRARTLIEKAMNAGRRAADLTRQMLAYSGKGRYVVGRVDVNSLVRDSQTLIRTAIPRSISLDLSLASRGCFIEADADQVKQVVMNLVTNAAEAIGGEAGSITLRTGEEYCDEQSLSQSRIFDKPPAGRFVYVEVTDTGCGMDEQTRQRMFEPFFSTKFTGRGLGMSAVLGIMNTHNGAIFVDSEPGKGSTIKVMFPAYAVQYDTAGMPEGRAGEPDAAPRAGTVLVVDDENDVREVCSVFVEHLGFKAITAPDGMEAVRIFKDHANEIVCVLLDLTMPGMDGISTYREMKGVRADIPVILSSGYSERDLSSRFRDLGLAGFIQKPYTLHELQEKIEQVVRRQGGGSGR